MNHPIETAVDTVAVATLGAVLFGWIQDATILLTFGWAIIRFYESATGVKFHETATMQAALKRLRTWRSG